MRLEALRCSVCDRACRYHSHPGFAVVNQGEMQPTRAHSRPHYMIIWHDIPVIAVVTQAAWGWTW